MARHEWYSDFHVKMSELSWQGMSSGDALVKEHCQRIEQETGERSKVLDVGCGTGAWAYERGEAGLDCDVLGIDNDLSMLGHRTTASSNGNVIFEAIDFTQPPPYSSYVFDVIHFRNLAWRAPKYHCIIERYARLLKPGGIMVITELELTFRPVYGIGAGCLSSWHKAVEAALGAQSIRAVLGSQHLRNMLLNTGLFDPNMVAEEMVLACGGANPEIGRFTNDMIYYGCKILEPALLQDSYGKADIEALILDCYHEIMNNPDQYYQKVNSVVATKKQY